MVKAVVTDFDGVLRHWRNDKIQVIEQRCKLPAGTLVNMCVNPERAEPALTGRISYEQWTKEIHRVIEAQHGRIIADYTTEAFKKARCVMDYDLLKQYQAIFPKAQLILAANATSRLPLELKAAKLHQRFDHIFNSSAMGVMMPQCGFFYGLLISTGLSPEDVVFVDDKLENVQAAQQVGMIAFHFNGRSKLVHELSNYALKKSMLA